MENYEKLSFTFKKMLRRMKTMRLRLKELTKTMNESKSKSFIKSDEYAEMQVEFDCINVGIGYLNIETKRTIIMLKICLYKQRVEKGVSITEPIIIGSVNKNIIICFFFFWESKDKEKLTSIVECRNSEKQIHLKRKRKHVASIHHLPSSEITRMPIVDSKLIDFTNRDSSEFVYGEVGFHGRNESTRSKEFVITGYVLILFVFLLWYYKLAESEKIKCRMKGI